MKNWDEKQTVKKGNLGEEIINEFLIEKGLTIYKPVSNNAHGFDRLVSKGKEKFIIVEIKTKAKRNYFPDTGINYDNYLSYKSISEKHNLPVWILFVDEMLGKVYGGNLAVLEEPSTYKHGNKKISYPMIISHNGTKIIYFYQPSMDVIKELNTEQVESIKKLSNRSYKY